MGAVPAVERPTEQEHQGQETEGLPVAPELRPLLPGGRLRPGSAITVGGDMPLLLALAAAAAAEAESWAVVGLPQLGVLAAETMGLDVGVGVFVDGRARAGRRWWRPLPGRCRWCCSGRWGRRPGG